MAAAPMLDDAPPRVNTFESLRFRNFRLFFGGQLISQIGNWLTLIAQALLVLKLTNNGFALGLLAACQFGPVLFLGAWAGLVADRSDKRKLLIIVQTFRCSSRSRLRSSPSTITLPWPRSIASPSSAVSRQRSTTRRVARMSSRWFPRPTCRTPSASTAL